MSKPAIRVEGLGKEYVIGGQASAGTTFREAMLASMRAPLRRLAGRGEANSKSSFWALRDLSFEIEPGEVVGIIGRNGAGKSTLLKILSRITAPTTGRVEIRGRVASLLEVGTGFHPELTGRENIRLNGAILGMKTAEIARKFDEIVDFAGVEKFIDTPVKRYSSGMQVRLAFAVAAHLDPEILLVDEVLAVGDAEFQKKCLGKMGEIAGRGGRTVLFVSHQLGMVSRLCEKGILLEKGNMVLAGDVQPVLARYMTSVQAAFLARSVPRDNAVPYIERVETIAPSGEPSTEFLFDEPVTLRCVVRGRITDPRTLLSTTIVSRNGDFVCSVMTEMGGRVGEDAPAHRIEVRFPPRVLAPKEFSFRMGLAALGGRVFDEHEMICPIKIVDNGSPMARYERYDYGHVILDCATSIGGVDE